MKLLIGQTWDGTPVGADEAVSLWLTDDGDALSIDVLAPLHADPAPTGPPGPTPRLWEHEVVELFILGEGEAYTEVELSPWGHHLVLRLQGRRQVVESGLPLDLRVSRLGASWWARARLPRSYLPPGPHRVNAYAIHGTGASRRHLAWTPAPGPAPDFHRLEAFPLLPLPGR